MFLKNIKNLTHILTISFIYEWNGEKVSKCHFDDVVNWIRRFDKEFPAYICEILHIEQDVYYHKYVMMITMMMVMLDDGLYRLLHTIMIPSSLDNEAIYTKAPFGSVSLVLLLFSFLVFRRKSLDRNKIDNTMHYLFPKIWIKLRKSFSKVFGRFRSVKSGEKRRRRPQGHQLKMGFLMAHWIIICKHHHICSLLPL
jgi:hypothetical protein